jgi:threonine synthase
MGYVQSLRGIGSGVEYPSGRVMNLCEEDGRPVEIILDTERLREEQPGAVGYDPERLDMWRFGALLPLDASDPADARFLTELGEGATPTRPWPGHALAQQHGFTLSVKDEGKAAGRPPHGANPTQSFKDRGMAMVVAMARQRGLERLAVPTQGNAGDALARYGAAAGLEVAIAMPSGTDRPILASVALQARLHPDNVHLDVVEGGTIREAAALVEEQYLGDPAEGGYFSVATFQEPGWRIEGKKTMGLELAEPDAPGEGWSLPDVIVYPTGGGTGVLGMWKAFGELGALGLVKPGERPRMVCVQSAATTPLVDAFERGAADTQTVQDPGATSATGLNVPGGVGHFRVLEILHESDGDAVAVPEDAIEEALAGAFEETGWWICPEGAACLAALEPLVERSTIRPGDEVVVFNTASLEKYLPAVRHVL